MEETLTEPKSSERGERIQVIVPPAVAEALQELATADDRTLSGLCSRVLQTWLQVRVAREGCKHREGVRIAMQHDVTTMVCIDCGETTQYSTDEIRRAGIIIHSRDQKEAS